MKICLLTKCWTGNIYPTFCMGLALHMSIYMTYRMEYVNAALRCVAIEM